MNLRHRIRLFVCVEGLVYVFGEIPDNEVTRWNYFFSIIVGILNLERLTIPTLPDFVPNRFYVAFFSLICDVY